MIEGHHGSVICLPCFKHALEQAHPSETQFECTLCKRTREPGTREWAHPAAEPSPGLNPNAVVCWECVRLAAKTFHKDKDVDFRWDPSDYPRE